MFTIVNETFSHNDFQLFVIESKWNNWFWAITLNSVTLLSSFIHSNSFPLILIKALIIHNQYDYLESSFSLEILFLLHVKYYKW